MPVRKHQEMTPVTGKDAGHRPSQWLDMNLKGGMSDVERELTDINNGLNEMNEKPNRCDVFWKTS